MKRRSKAGGKPAESRSRKTPTPKRRNAPKAVRRRNSSAADQETNVARLTRERDEALEQQTATAEILRVISASPSELEPVFNAMLANATRICNAKFGILWLCEGGAFRCVALHKAPLAFAEQYRRQPVIQPVPGTGLGRLSETRQVTQVADMTTIQPYIERDPFVVTSVELGGYRTVLDVPMLKEDTLIGAVPIYRVRETQRPLYLISAIPIGMTESNDQHPTSNPKFRAGRLYLGPEDLRLCWSNRAQRNQSPTISRAASLLPLVHACG